MSEATVRGKGACSLPGSRGRVPACSLFRQWVVAKGEADFLFRQFVHGEPGLLFAPPAGLFGVVEAQVLIGHGDHLLETAVFGFGVNPLPFAAVVTLRG